MWVAPLACATLRRPALLLAGLLALVPRPAFAALDYPLSYETVDVQGLRILAGSADSTAAARIQVEVVVAGGGLGGVAAALALCEEGRHVLLTEETDWLGGQASSQGVSALDENRWVDRGGATRLYREFRETIRRHYLPRAMLPDSLRAAAAFNPGNCWVSRLAFEPAVAHEACSRLLEPYRRAGLLTLRLRHKVVAARREQARVTRLLLLDLDSQAALEVTPDLVIDATELGDLLPLCDVAYVSGRESRAMTGERDAADGESEPQCVQSFTYSFVLETGGGGCADGPEPPGYRRHLASQPFNTRMTRSMNGEAKQIEVFLFDKVEVWPGSLWEYRRLIEARQFDRRDYPGDLSLINWMGNDYHEGSILDVPPREMLDQLQAARSLSLSYYHFIRTQMARPDGHLGYDEVCLRPDVMGTADGLSKYPYARESRRIVAMETLRQQDVEKPPVGIRLRGRHFVDAVAIGAYDIDLHAGPCHKSTLQVQTLPFQIPLGALIPVGTENLLPAAKNAGVTHITNGCTRVHSVQWAIGEAAGRLAAHCLERDISPEQVWLDPAEVLMLQARIVRGGAPIFWYGNLPSSDPRFAEAQLQPFRLAHGMHMAGLQLQSLTQSFNWASP